MAPSGQACIEVKFVMKSYGKTVALDDVSFSIPCGERYALLGPNGAGKSTTLKLLVGLLKPDTGTIRISGYEPFSSEAKSILGYLPEDATPYRTLSVRENLEYIAALRGVKDVREATDRFLDELSLREYERAKVGKLSRHPNPGESFQNAEISGLDTDSLHPYHVYSYAADREGHHDLKGQDCLEWNH